jgi:RNA polymerase sigma-70 factor (ECF subfamily)
MTEAPSFQELISRMRRGDPDAAAEIVGRYGPTIQRTVRLQLRDSRLRGLLDSADICQSVLGSFFVRAACGQYELQTPEQLVRLLRTMARNKLINQVKKQRAAKRDQARNVAGAVEFCADREPSPSKQVELRELLQLFRERLSPEELYLAEQRALDRPWDALGAELGRSPEALRKQLARAVDRAADELDLDA